MEILAIDPGEKESGWLIFQPSGRKIRDAGVDSNQMVRDNLIVWRGLGGIAVVIEDIQSYGMPVGRSTFETVRWMGRFEEIMGSFGVMWLPRRAVKLHLCGSARAKDSNVRQALLDKFRDGQGGGKTPQIGTKKQPGPLYGISGHLWSALALAVTYTETKLGVSCEPCVAAARLGD